MIDILMSPYAINLLGRLGENEHRRMLFPIAEYTEMYPGAAYALIYHPPGASEGYPVAATSHDERYLYWIVTNTDLAAEGSGLCELIVLVDSVVAKSDIYETRVLYALDGAGTPPPPWEGWQAEFARIKGEAEDAAEAAEDSATAALGSAQTATGASGAAISARDAAQGYASDADGHARDAAGSATAAQGHADAAEQSAEDAQDAAEGAAGSATQAGQSAANAASSAASAAASEGNAAGSASAAAQSASAAAASATAAAASEAAAREAAAASRADYTELAGEVSDLSDEVADKYEKPATGIPASDLADGVVPEVPVQDVQINGTSVLVDGVANVPMASSSVLGVVSASTSNGLSVNASGEICVSAASSSNIKSSSTNYRPITPYHHHESVFYGLAKVAGSDEKDSTLPVGQYTDAAKVAIQKMLGIYQPPWELIREDTFTNATEASHIISVDALGQAFELTDIYLEFWLPTQETDASVGSSGRIDYYYSNAAYLSTYHGAKTQTAGTYTNGTFALLRRDSGGLLKTNGTYNTMGTDRVALAVQGRVDENRSCLIIGEFTFTKIEIKAITGTGHYKLYGKRAWN